MPGSSTTPKVPVVYLPHGGGPWPFMDVSAFGPATMYDGMRAYLKGLHTVLVDRPKAVLVISAHWEEAVPTLMGAAAPPMLYDYSGFPPETYQVRWPAPGAPDVAAAATALLEAAGIACATDPTRGFDHGTYVPLGVAWPDPEVPTLQLSLKQGLDPAEHLAIGRALAPLRERGVFLVGSGMSYHNMRGLLGREHTAADDSKRFDDWLAETVAADRDERERRLTAWTEAPAARACHPREEHLLPLMVCAGAAGDDAGTTPYRDVVMNAHVSAAHFG